MRCLKLKGGKSRVEFISSFHLVFAGAIADKIKHPYERDKPKFHASFILTPFPIDLLLKACTQGVFGSWYIISLLNRETKSMRDLKLLDVVTY